MPFNSSGDLYKSEIVNRLQNLGFDVKSVQALNKILEEMGFQEHYGNNWVTTKKAVNYTIYRDPTYDVNAWHPEVIDAIISYLENK